MSVKFELDNGKMNEYPTLQSRHGSEGDYPDEPYYTKCGLSFKKDPRDGACGHLDCAIDAARGEAIIPIGIYCAFSIWLTIVRWYDMGDLLAGIRYSQGMLIVFAPILLLMSILPFRRWLELREYKNHGTINGRTARRI